MSQRTATREAVRRLYESGTRSPTIIARILRVHSSTVLHHFVALGYQRTKQLPLRERVEALRAAKYPWPTVARLAHTKLARLADLCDEWGIPGPDDEPVGPALRLEPAPCVQPSAARIRMAAVHMEPADPWAGGPVPRQFRCGTCGGTADAPTGHGTCRATYHRLILGVA